MIVLNGEPHEQGAGEPVAALVADLGLPEHGHGVAVAIDGEVIPRAAWESRVIADGAHVEVLTAMQGG
ncbi:MAG TPA: sulfur carrier protein ThiS [Solirubrobacteraceae bacterium]|nr:sulfur carrier protein ThiS [Solirubrobacteraceae bacterium]